MTLSTSFPRSANRPRAAILHAARHERSAQPSADRANCRWPRGPERRCRRGASMWRRCAGRCGSSPTPTDWPAAPADRPPRRAGQVEIGELGARQLVLKVSALVEAKHALMGLSGAVSGHLCDRSARRRMSEAMPSFWRRTHTAAVLQIPYRSSAARALRRAAGRYKAETEAKGANSGSKLSAAWMMPAASSCRSQSVTMRPFAPFGRLKP